MRRLSVAQLAGAAFLAALSASGPCAARAADTPATPHFMTVDLPGGGVARITYFGNVAPHIVVDPEAPAYVAAPGYSMADPFLALDRMAAMMDAETSAMLREAAAMAAAPMPAPGGLIEANIGDAPAGAVSTTYVASFGGTGMCTQSVQVVSQGPGLRPRVVSQSSGDCAAATPSAHTVRARADSPYSGMIRPAVIYTPDK